MVSISKAYQDLNRKKALINQMQRERAARYIEAAAPKVLSNPVTSEREITTVSNLLQSGIDDHGLVNYLNYLTEKTDPGAGRMIEQKRRLNDMKEARANGYL